MWDLQVSLHFTCKIWQKSVYLISALCVTDGHTHTHIRAHTHRRINCITLVLCDKLIDTNITRPQVPIYRIPHHNRFKALFPGPPGLAGARRETSGLHGARED